MFAAVILIEDNMETTVKKSAKKQQTEYNEPKRLSKLGQWRRDNPGGIGIIVDRRAVNK